MIVDIGATLGHYPFRRLRTVTARERVALMDRFGIDRAVVTSLHAAYYRDAHQGNDELFAETRAFPGRFIPIATANPRYVGWERDLEESVERWNSKAVCLVPEQHGYQLSDEHGRAALAKIARHGIPVLLRQRFEDRRQRHAWDRAEGLQFNELLDCARAHPSLKFVLVNWAGLNGPRMVEAGLKGRCLIDFARMQVLFRKDVPALVETLGPESIAFGTHMGFDYVGPSLVKLASIQQLWPQHEEAIRWRNAAKFLRFQA